jgi:hypothetical protein
MVASAKSTVSWISTLVSDAQTLSISKIKEGIYPKYGGSSLLRNVGIYHITY